MVRLWEWLRRGSHVLSQRSVAAADINGRKSTHVMRAIASSVPALCWTLLISFINPDKCNQQRRRLVYPGHVHPPDTCVCVCVVVLCCDTLRHQWIVSDYWIPDESLWALLFSQGAECSHTLKHTQPLLLTNKQRPQKLSSRHLLKYWPSLMNIDVLSQYFQNIRIQNTITLLVHLFLCLTQGARAHTVHGIMSCQYVIIVLCYKTIREKHISLT